MQDIDKQLGWWRKAMIVLGRALPPEFTEGELAHMHSVRDASPSWWGKVLISLGLAYPLESDYMEEEKRILPPRKNPMVSISSDSQKIALDPEFLRRLARLKLETRMILGGVMKGEKRSRKHGTSVEFADYRDYHLGDDLRYLDWNIYARLERFFLKLFQEEEDLTVHVILDSSASMASGDPQKGFYAKQLAAALSYIALTNLDRVTISTFSSAIGPSSRPMRGRSHLATSIDLLNSVEMKDRTDFERAMKAFTLRNRTKGLVFLISDFFDPLHLEEGLKRLVYGKHDVLLLQVLDRGEIEPELRGDWALTDSETGDVVEVSMSPRLITDYKRRVNSYLNDLRTLARKLHLGYALTTTDVPVEDFLLKELVWTGFVR